MMEISIASIVLLIIAVLIELIIIGIVLNKGIKQLYKANFWKAECVKVLKEKQELLSDN